MISFQPRFSPRNLLMKCAPGQAWANLRLRLPTGFDIRIVLIDRLEPIHPRYEEGARWGVPRTPCGYSEWLRSDLFSLAAGWRLLKLKRRGENNVHEFEPCSPTEAMSSTSTREIKLRPKVSKKKRRRKGVARGVLE